MGTVFQVTRLSTRGMAARLSLVSKQQPVVPLQASQRIQHDGGPGERHCDSGALVVQPHL